MIIISDTSPINYLILINEINLLPQLFDKIIIPQAVWNELQDSGSPQDVKDWVFSNPGWIKIKSASTLDHTILLGAGEVEAISLAREINADLILIDDRKARRIAIERGLNVAGTINILESASKRNLIDIKKAFKDLEQTNFRIAPKILKKILDRN